MDYKRKYEIQLKTIERLEQDLERLKLENSELKTIIKNGEEKQELIDKYLKDLSEQIDDAKNLKSDIEKSVNDMNSMKKEYRSKLKSFLKFIRFNALSIKMKGY